VHTVGEAALRRGEQTYAQIIRLFNCGGWEKLSGGRLVIPKLEQVEDCKPGFVWKL